MLELIHLPVYSINSVIDRFVPIIIVITANHSQSAASHINQLEIMVR